MKLLTDQNMRTFAGIVVSSAAAGFPVTNLQQYDPGLIWKAAAFSADISIVIDLGAAVAIPQIWLNNANFTSATLQANAADSWGSPSVSTNVTLAKDDIGIYKGFFDLSATNYRYVRIVIPVQTLVSGTVPQFGNIIIGTASDLRVASWAAQTARNYSKFQPDGGGYRKNAKGRARHVFSVGVSGTKAEVDAIVLSGWEAAIIFTDLADVADSYLVYPPESTGISIKNPLDAERSFALEELV
jgi:hypothetical protein